MNRRTDRQGSYIDESEELEWRSRFVDYESHLGSPNLIQMCEVSSSQPIYAQDIPPLGVNDDLDKENVSMEQMGNALKHKGRANANSDKKSSTHGAMAKKKMAKEEQICMLEEKKLRKEQEKLQKAALKAEAAEFKKLQKQRQKWEK